jgi:xylulokinase
LAVDLGTSGCKTAVISADARILAWAFEEVRLIVLADGGAEQSPHDWWSALVSTARQAVHQAGVRTEQIAAVCCSTQGEGTVPVGHDLEPLANAILWMDMRGAPDIQKHASAPIHINGYHPLKLLRWLRLTGGAPNLAGKDPAGHMLFLKRTQPTLFQKTHKFLNVLDYINLRLTGRCVATVDSILTSWVTDNRNPHNIHYDDRLLAHSGVPREKFPDIVPCTQIIGTLTASAANQLGLSPQTQVVAGAIDTTAAAIGSGAIGLAQPHLYIGTSSWIASHVPRKKTDPFASIAAVPCAVPDRYLMIAMQTTAGGNLSFLKSNILYHQDELLREAQVPDVYKILDRIVDRVPVGSRGLIYLPWLHGERCPVDAGTLRAGLINLSLEHTREDIIRAFFEGVALNTRWMLASVTKFLGQPVEKLRMIGGGAASNVWRQIFADALGIPIEPIAEPLQANSLGAFGIAAVGLGWLSFEQLAGVIKTGPLHEPDHRHHAIYDERFDQFQVLYKSLAPHYRRWNRLEGADR